MNWINIIKNFFALIGITSTLAAIYILVHEGDFLQQLDPKAPQVISDVGQKLVRSNITTALVYRIPLAEGVSIEEAVESLKLQANLKNLKLVGEKPMYKEVESLTGKSAPYVAVYEFCDVLVAMDVLAYNPDYLALMPCRVGLFEDKDGKAWFVTINMDLLIHGGKELDPELKKQAIRVKDTLMAIMESAAKGEL